MRDDVHKWMQDLNTGDDDKVLMVREQTRTRSNQCEVEYYQIIKDRQKPVTY